MSQLAGKFKAKVLYPEPSKSGAPSPYLQVLFKLTHQLVGEDWEEIPEESQDLASYTYWTRKEKREGAKMSAFEVSKASFKKAWGFDMTDCESIEDMSGKLKAVSDHMILVLEEDVDSNFHKIKWINNPTYSGGPAKSKKTGLAELQELF
tara:strand:+ start:3387 stop:3836 length:450 start_codon:yes stop_codon:yes gene_type:complete